MILDELIRHFPALASLGTQGVVKVPFPVASASEGRFVPRGLVPMDSKTTQLLGIDAKAPWPVTVLVSETPERGVLVVKSTGGAEGSDAIDLIDLTRYFSLDPSAHPSSHQLVVSHYPGFQRTKAGVLSAPRWLVACLLWTAAHHPTLADWAKKNLQVGGLSTETSVTRDEIAAVIHDRWNDAAAILGALGLRPNVRPNVSDPAQFPDEQLTQLVGQLTVEAHAALIAAVATFALFNTRNVTTRRVQPSARAFIRRGERPPVAYHEILWRPFESKVERASGAVLSGEAVAVAWQRGHFKTYSADRPLFGQHVGRFWWQRNFRGRNAAHRIESTYRLSIPTSNLHTEVAAV